MGYSAQLPALTHWFLQHIQPEMICSKNTAPPSLQCPCREAHISRNRIITSLQQVWKAFRLFQHTSIRLPREQEPALFLQDLTRTHTHTHIFFKSAKIKPIHAKIQCKSEKILQDTGTNLYPRRWSCYFQSRCVR